MAGERTAKYLDKKKSPGLGRAFQFRMESGGSINGNDARHGIAIGRPAGAVPGAAPGRVVSTVEIISACGTECIRLVGRGTRKNASAGAIIEI